jgi:hypothetical protein
VSDLVNVFCRAHGAIELLRTTSSGFTCSSSLILDCADLTSAGSPVVATGCGSASGTADHPYSSIRLLLDKAQFPNVEVAEQVFAAHLSIAKIRNLNKKWDVYPLWLYEGNRICPACALLVCLIDRNRLLCREAEHQQAHTSSEQQGCDSGHDGPGIASTR